jgi:serine/threonine-protein kinase
MGALALSISDGEVVDLEASERSAADENQRQLIHYLWIAAEIARGRGWEALAAEAESAARRSASGDPLEVAAALAASASSAGVPSPEEAAEEEAPPSRWGHLEVHERIGGGAFGSVYRALDTKLNSERALKLLRADRRPDPRASELEAHVLREARNLARVQHPNVVTVFGADSHEGRAGLWMEFIAGQTLEDILQKDGRFGPSEAMLIGIVLCRALSAVHGAGIVHRDIKARNVMRAEGGRIVLMDFGAGRKLQDGTDSQASTIAGTPLYMAPEVLRGGPPTARADVYALGVLLYRLVTREYPFVGKTVAELRTAHAKRDPRLLRDVRSDLPPAFIDVVEKAIAVEPEARFASLGRMEKALAAAMRAGSRRREALRGLAFGAGAVGLVVVAVLGLRVWQEHRARVPAVPSAPQAHGWTADGSVVSADPGDQVFPSLVPDPDGGFITVWQDSRSGNKDIYAQRFDPFGAPLWREGGAPVCIAAGDQLLRAAAEYPLAPTLASDSNGGAFFVWFDNRAGGTEIFAQHLTPSGAVADGWPPDGMALCSRRNGKQSLAIAKDGHGGAIVAWEDLLNASYNIYAQGVDASGAVRWTPNGIAVCEQTLFDQRAPHLVQDDEGGAIIAWVDYRADGDIYAQRVSDTGKLLWPRRGLRVCGARGEQRMPEIVSDDAGGAILCWEDKRNGNLDIFTQRLTASGAIAPGWIRDGVAACAFPLHNQCEPRLVWDRAGGAILAWFDWRNLCEHNRTCADIYAQHVDARGKAMWSAWGLPVCTVPGDKVHPDLCSDGEGGAVFVWWDSRNAVPPFSMTPGAGDIYAQRLDASGKALWPGGWIAVSTAQNSQQMPRVVSDRVGGAYVVWEDARAGNRDIYSNRISAAGIAAGAPPLLQVPPGLTVHADPGRESARVQFTVTAKGNPDPEVTCHPISGSVFPVGNTTVECSAKNSSGTRKASFTVTVTGDESSRAARPAPER